MLLLLDRARSQILRRSLKLPWLSRIYTTRAERTFFLFGLSLVLNAILLCTFPTFSFYWGPLLLGIPHLVASLRSSGRVAETGVGLVKVLFSLQKVWWASLALKAVVYFTKSDILPDGAFEMIAMAGTGVVLMQNRKKINLVTLVSVIIFALCFLIEPVIFSIFLLLAHNLIAFAFWFRAGNTRAEKGVAVLSFILLGFAIMIVAPHCQPNLKLVDALFGDRDQIPGAVFLFKFFVLSQAAHYFIWIKAIPDYQNTSTTPAPFSTTLYNLKRELGLNSVSVLAVCALALLAVTFKLGIEDARTLYLHFSSFHGFSEIAILFATLRARAA